MIKMIRLAHNDMWDIIVKTEYEIVPHEGTYYPFRRTIIYTPVEQVSKVRTI
jgi:hypothetical protein